VRLRLLPLLLSSAVVGACDHTSRVATGVVQLTETPVVVRFAAPVRAVGPTRELCLVGSPGNVETVRPGGSTVVRAVLITSSGLKDTMRTPDYSRARDDMVCLWDHALGLRPDSAEPRLYTGVELSSSAFLRLREVRWWSGRRTKFL
jgi:hypothetical protein